MSRRKHKSKTSTRKRRSQRGGAAAFDSAFNDSMPSDLRSAAGVAGLDERIAELQHVIPRQMGGRKRKNKSRRNWRQKSRRQRGGMMDFNGSYSVSSPLPGVNSQFTNEGSVNPLYSSLRGAQGY